MEKISHLGSVLNLCFTDIDLKIVIVVVQKYNKKRTIQLIFLN